MNTGITNKIDFDLKANNLVGALTEPESKLLALHLELVIFLVLKY